MRRLLPLVLLAACVAPAGDPRPASVRLTQAELLLRLDDGTLCRADWRAAPAGRLEDCGPGYGYAVHLEPLTNPARMLAEGIELALGGEFLAPMAEVVITDPAGIDWVFASPPAG